MLRSFIILMLCAGSAHIEPAWPVSAAVPPPVPRSAPIAEPARPSWLWIRAWVTAYSPHDPLDGDHWSTQDTYTATMRDWRVHPYGIAADPRMLPYGTRVHVPGYLPVSYPQRAWEIDDTGGGLRQSFKRGVLHIDLRYRTTYSARQWTPAWHWVALDVSSLSEKHYKRLVAQGAEP